VFDGSSRFERDGLNVGWAHRAQHVLTQRERVLVIVRRARLRARALTLLETLRRSLEPLDLLRQVALHRSGRLAAAARLVVIVLDLHVRRGV
jgi:hypothetical protein